MIVPNSSWYGTSANILKIFRKQRIVELNEDISFIFPLLTDKLHFCNEGSFVFDWTFS